MYCLVRVRSKKIVHLNILCYVQFVVIPSLIGFLTSLDCPSCRIANHCTVLSLLLTCSSMEYMTQYSLISPVQDNAWTFTAQCIVCVQCKISSLLVIKADFPKTTLSSHVLAISCFSFLRFTN